jgi:hypothetical protein
VKPPQGVGIRPAAARDLAQIAALDSVHSGFARGRVLAHLLARATDLAHVAEGSDGRLAGYALGRDGHAAMHVGPVVAEEEATGLALLSSAMAATRQRVILDVPDRQQAVGAWLSAQGATTPRAFMRMLRGPCPAVEQANCIFALAGPELA